MTQAVRHGVDPEHPEYLQTLANLRTRISDTTADDGVDRADNVSGLSKIYQDMGAYGDLMPGNGDRGTFKPSPPLPVQECSESRSVECEGRLLVRDCSVLLDLKDTLKGTATLNWSKDTALSRWTGITTGGTPQRVAGLSLADNMLTGSIPAELGDMPGLEELWLAGSQLSGRIPVRLGRLELTDLFLSENPIEGCLPYGLRDVARNDFQIDPVAVMPDCRNEAPVFSESSYSFTVGEDAANGDVVGRLAAEDPDGTTVTYAITAGNGDGKFGINADRGRLSVAGELDYETSPSYSLTLQATDGDGATTDVTVSIGVSDVAE